MIYNTFLFLLVTGIGVFLFLKAMKLSSKKGEESEAYKAQEIKEQEIKEQEIRKLLEKIIQSEINKTEDFEKKIVLENGAEIDMTDVVKIDSHPNFSEKRA